ncbi:MAG TPA: YoaK family protein [Jatrophihabitans sp.]|nr:YoaK family protein [Jatrophihabitans sp.]
MLIALTAVAAGTDAISYLGFGSVFPANMTGNTVLLGIGLASGDYGGAARSLVALGAFVLGAMAVGLALVGRPWRSMIAAASGVELVLLAATCGWWLAAGNGSSDAVYGMIALVSTAMGVQSATVSGLDVGVSTTYITGTWTSVSTWAASLVRPAARTSPSASGATDRHARRAAVLVTYFCAALAAGFLEHGVGAPAIALPLGVLAVVAAACTLTAADRARTPS